MSEIFHLTHNNGTWSEYDSAPAGSDVAIAAAAGMGGTAYGVKFDADIGTASAAFFTSPAISGSATYFRFGFYLNKNTIAAAANNILLGSFADIEAGGNDVIAFNIRRTLGNIKLEVDIEAGVAFLDGDTLSAGELKIEFVMQKESAPAANDGIATLYINNVLKDQVLLLDNGAMFTNMASGSNLTLRKDEIIATTGNIYVDEIILRDDNTPIFSTGFTLAGMTKPCDVDADGDFLYIAVLQSGTPILIKLATALNADGTIVFNPGAGTDIGVQCGRFDADMVWVAGDFDGTNTVEKSEDAGTSFTVKDDGTFTAVSAFIIGPDSDERVLIFDTAGAIEETIDDGVSWSQKESGLGYDCHAMDRLDINVEEVIFGNDSGATHVVDYSVNTGQDLEDYTLTLPVTQDVTGVIVN